MSKKSHGKKKKRSKKSIDTQIEKMLDRMKAHQVKKHLERS
jgi:hypothetical protein